MRQLRRFARMSRAMASMVVIMNTCLCVTAAQSDDGLPSGVMVAHGGLKMLWNFHQVPPEVAMRELLANAPQDGAPDALQSLAIMREFLAERLRQKDVLTEPPSLDLRHHWNYVANPANVTLKPFSRCLDAGMHQNTADFWAGEPPGEVRFTAHAGKLLPHVETEVFLLVS
jgi:hypothetical protein